MYFEPAIFFQAVLSLFAIVDPLGGLPVFLSLTQGATAPERQRVFRIAVATSFILIVGFALVGLYAMERVFHITMSEFTFAGGLLLVVTGVHDMLRTDSPEPALREEVSARDRERVHRLRALAVSPIACPLLAGPGTIVTVILFQGQYGHLFALSVCVVVFGLTLLILTFAGFLSRLMGRVGTLAVARVMQIFIIAIGVHFMFSGFKGAFPGLFA
ncbi:MarC family protein [bacterium]|nr:MarC family protein [bacterium]